jgi:hypothetical protein
MRWLIVLTLLMTCVGCATYEYDIVQPEALAGHIPAKPPRRFEIGPLGYQWQSYDNHLILQVLNTTDDPIELLGAQSYVVDPTGQSHPLTSQTLAPHSFIKLILPPIPPRIQRGGPSIGIGLGVGSAGGAWDRGYGGVGVAEPIGRPDYLVYTAGSTGEFWEWDGQSDVRLLLVFRAGDQTLRQAFVLHRRKM